MTAQDVLDAHASVLADLRQKRDEIETAIRVIESIYGLRSIGVEEPTSQNAVTPDVSLEAPGAFLGMSIADATKKLLASRRAALSSTEVATALKAGGLAMTSAEPVNTIGSVLGRRFDQVGDIVRVERGKWGLQEWYPHTNFRKKQSAIPIVVVPSDESDPDARPWDDLPPSKSS